MVNNDKCNFFSLYFSNISCALSVIVSLLVDILALLADILFIGRQTFLNERIPSMCLMQNIEEII